MHEALHVLGRPELAPRMIEPGHHQGSEQGVVGGLNLVIADTVEQCPIDELRPDKPELALSQACKHPVVCCRFIIELEERHTCPVVFDPSVSSFNEQLYLSGVVTVAYYLYALTFPVHLLHNAHRRSTRFVQFLLDKHAPKIEFCPQTVSEEVELFGGSPHQNQLLRRSEVTQNAT
uniref:hypothetical protein n=1 Tax=Prevotella heparinolytica TaxID=28113 RepID=UPI00359F31BB